MISKRTRRKFADFASDFAILRLIQDVFEAEDFAERPGYVGTEYGQRRTLVAAYHANIDMRDPAQLARLVNVYLDAINSWGRTPEGALHPAAHELLKNLRLDGIPVNDDGELTGPLPKDAGSLSVPLTNFDRLDEPEVVEQHLQRISANTDSDPAAAIGAAKELVESVCKVILDDFDVEYRNRDDLLDLYKKVAKVIGLSRDAVPGSAKGSEAAQRVLQNLATAVQSLAELRNELGIGHGRTKLSAAFARHARLAANAARTVVEFLLETWHERRAATDETS